mgnify:CR=1 FL=1
MSVGIQRAKNSPGLVYERLFSVFLCFYGRVLSLISFHEKSSLILCQAFRLIFNTIKNKPLYRYHGKVRCRMMYRNDHQAVHKYPSLLQCAFVQPLPNRF